jgi:methyl-accepting chemotaxis protein
VLFRTEGREKEITSMKTISRLFQLTIARKLLLGFLSCGILGVLFALIALSNFQKLNEINNRIIERDVPLAETANEMVEALIGQDLYGRRSLILKSSDMEGLFWKRSNEFEMLQRKIAGLPDPPALSLHRLATVHKEYNSLYEAEFDKKDLSSSTSGDDQLMRGKREELFELLKGISQNARKDQNEKNLETRSIGDSAFWTVLGLSIGGLLLGIFIAVLITHNISGSIRLLEHSTREISEGKFNQVSQVRNQDELGDLSRAFQMMAQRLKQAEEERERLIQSLRDSLAKIKRLQGMLPICASCKRIRDDQGYWKDLEAYIQEHSEAEFTHGFCPDCAKKLYGISIDKDNN